jgi:pimeloyl-ACP methyl ester carboxylesterase
VVDAVLGITSLVEAMHARIANVPGFLGAAATEQTDGLTGLVYRTIRGVTRLVGGGIDVALGALSPMLGQLGTSSEREAMLSALNGVLGDHLVASANPLAIPMTLRRNGRPLVLSREGLAAAIPDATGRIVVLLHGLCMNDLQWRRKGHDHGEQLVAEGFTPVYLYYNSGRHISENGRDFADLMETLSGVWPVPVEQIVLIGHSMGGLVARSACHHAAQAGHAWLRLLRKMIFLGSPHHGSPLEKGGHWIDMLLEATPYTRPLSRLGKIRSAGITDLRHGYVRDEDWLGCDRFGRTAPASHPLPLPEGVQCYAAAATTDPAGRRRTAILGDGLVPVRSALGKHRNPARDLGIPESRQWTGYGMNHLDLLSSPEVYAQLRRWVTGPD